MARSQWIRVSKQSPCPVCKAPDWCSIAADATVAMCMRIEAGCFKSKNDRNGVPYYLHRLADGPRPLTERGARPCTETKRADAASLNEVYSALLARVSLSKAHRQNLQQRGLTDSAIDKGGYRTLPIGGRPRIVRELRESFGDKLLRVPGFVVKEGRSGRYLTLRGSAGLLIPCRDRAGRIVALKVRSDDTAQDRPRYSYVSSVGHGGPGPGSPLHFPLGMQEVAEVVRLIEGELKADIIQALTGLPTLSIPGANSWRPALEDLRASGCKTVRLAFDADASNNSVVARALVSCSKALPECGLGMEMERWDLANGKGLDDLLAAGKIPEVLQGDAARSAVREILASATFEEKPTPPDELLRVQEVLQTGGAEALFRDKVLLRALAKLAAQDEADFAAFKASVKGVLSTRELERVLKPLIQQAKDEHHGSSPAAETPTYFVQNGRICRKVITPNGPVVVALCNFAARIVEEVTCDDGAERSTVLVLEGALSDGRSLLRAEVPAEKFQRMEWVTASWGAEAIVHAGMGTRDHVRCALQALADSVQRRTVYAHTGWREVGSIWIYLHAGGAIGPEGTTTKVETALPEALCRYELPHPPTGVALAEAVRASLGLLAGLAPDPIAFALLAAPYRAALGGTDFSQHLVGPTDCYKTELSALAQQHFGVGLDARHLPASWSSTGNALEGLAFAAKDALLVVDDFAPTGSSHDVQRYHREADRLFRAQGNRSGRLRMRADATLRPAKPPRGLLLSTGEDTPRGQSLRARLIGIEISQGDVDVKQLTICQRDAADGKFVLAMAGYVRWLAGQYETIRLRLRQEQVELREYARANGQHSRTPGIVADLAVGLRYLLEFAEAAGAIAPEEKKKLWDRGWSAFTQAAEAQAVHIATGDPTVMFLRLLSAALASGRAHVADTSGEMPTEPIRWGWRLKIFRVGPSARQEWQPQGNRIGWVEGESLYLEPEASYAEAQRLAEEQGDSLPVTPQTLRRRLKEKGLLVTTDERRQKLTIRKTLQGTRQDVLHLAALGTASTSRTSPTGPEGEDPGEFGPETRADSGAEKANRNGEAAHVAPVILKENESVGRMGRSDEGKEGDVGRRHDKQQGSDWGDWQ